MMVIDPDVAALLEAMPCGGPVAQQTPGELRARMRTAIRNYEGPRFRPDRVERIEDRVIRGMNGEIPVRVYSAAGGAPTAVIVFFHGGSWSAGDLDTHDKITRRLCVGAGAIVVSVDYRLAPEHPFPAGFQDCWDGLLWASGTYPGVPLLVAGDSAGGTLAACIALRSRDEGGPALAGQVLVYPCVDDDLDASTMHDYAGRFAVTREDLATYFDWYLPRVEDRADGYAMPGFAGSLDHLPPTVMATAGLDPLRAADEEYVDRLRAAGVPVVLLSQPTLIHGWLDFYPRVPAAASAVEQLIEAIRGLITNSATASHTAHSTAHPAATAPAAVALQEELT